MRWLQVLLLRERLIRQGCSVITHSRLQSSGAGSAPNTSFVTPAPPPGPLQVNSCIQFWKQVFSQHKIPEPEASSEYIVAHVLGAKTIQSLENKQLSDLLTTSQMQYVWELCTRRLQRMPVQYVIGEWDFRHLTLKMKPPVFIPRPETEELVVLVEEDLLSQDKADISAGPHRDITFLEVGCGSGAICLSLLHLLPRIHAIAVDKSAEAINLTRENADRLGLCDRLNLLQMDILLDSHQLVRECGAVDFIISNPPYVFSEDMNELEPEILQYEDLQALDGGEHGLEVIQQILSIGKQILKKNGKIFLEVEPRHPAVLQMLISQGCYSGIVYKDTKRDFCERPRFCILQKTFEEV
ncbi:MTRF1L release factor glutamine methyltransferase isoform X1 [Polypterus senegalus]|uniref:MTRF1L release factor glutamine methyltransferase isoform X1 n=2 Tax=Polypterus senegalus TaxID=55291 RepID=UPI0019626304|nr:MTRF1L release factor glutamine methyltransferase isoform X1 [Polypterus senegalus]